MLGNLLKPLGVRNGETVMLPQDAQKRLLELVQTLPIDRDHLVAASDLVSRIGDIRHHGTGEVRVLAHALHRRFQQLAVGGTRTVLARHPGHTARSPTATTATQSAPATAASPRPSRPHASPRRQTSSSSPSRRIRRDSSRATAAASSSAGSPTMADAAAATAVQQQQQQHRAGRGVGHETPDDGNEPPSRPQAQATRRRSLARSRTRLGPRSRPSIQVQH